MTVVKTLNLASYLLQAIALCLATKIDLRAMAIERAENALPDSLFADHFNSVMDGTPHHPSAEELALRELECSVDGARNDALLRWSIALVFLSIVLQGIATCLSPD